MGGHASGDVASRIVKETLLGSALNHAAARRSETGARGGCTGRRRQHRALEHGLDSRRHSHRGSSRGSSPGSATAAPTCGAAESLRQLTRDHSYLEVLREQENLSETQLRGHPNKNLVTQTLGIGTPDPSLITRAAAQRRLAAPVQRRPQRRARRCGDRADPAHARGAGCGRRCADCSGAGARRTRQRQRGAGGVRRAEWRKLRSENDSVARSHRRRLRGGLLAVLWWWLYGR